MNYLLWFLWCFALGILNSFGLGFLRNKQIALGVFAYMIFAACAVCGLRFLQ